MVGAVDWSNRDLRHALLRGVNMTGATLHGTLLNEAVLEAADLTQVNFEGAVLVGADLRGASYDVETCVKKGWLKGSIAGAVDWSGRFLWGAQLQGVDMCGADLTRVNLEDSDLEGDPNP